MAEDKKILEVAEVLVHSQTLNTASQSLTDICNNMYDVITKLQENQSFKSKLASGEYYSKFDRLNGQVPKFTEGVLKFSKFLSGYLLDSHQEMDENTKQMVEQTLEESLSQLAAVSILGGAAVDLTKISSTAQGALQAASSGEGWIESSKINTEAFMDTGNLEFVTRDDGSIMITRNGVPIGFTTEEGIIKNESTASEAVVVTESNNSSDSAEKYMSQSEYETLPEMQKQIVDKEGYKVVSDSEYVKMSQGTGQNKADSYDARISSESQAQVERVNASQAIAQNEISTRKELLANIDKESNEAYDVYTNPNASYIEQEEARVKMDSLKWQKDTVSREISDLESGKVLDLKPYLDQKADIPVANAKEFTKPGWFNDWALNGVEKLSYDPQTKMYKAYNSEGKYMQDFSIEYLSNASINYKD